MTGKEILERLNSAKTAEPFLSLYGRDDLDNTRQRYSLLVNELIDDSAFPGKEFPETRGNLRLFSVPGRTELGGNHTDHNRGKVLAASIHLDSIAVVAPRQDKKVFFRSAGYPDAQVDLSDLSIKEGERETTSALIRGIAAEFSAQGTPVNGFTAAAASTVLTGSGLSSSAAVEVLIAKIFDALYCGGKRSALKLAQIGQKAENVYFGKPCGLMDQTACASGGAVAIDFENLLNPRVTQINFDPAALGFALCVIDTRGNHADLTPDYAAIPGEMKMAAAFYGKTVLRELDEETLISRLPELRKAAGDRAVLRALHFFSENRRVDAMLKVLEQLNAPPQNTPLEQKKELMEAFLALVRESGDSSWELLQNVYTTENYDEQSLSLALALTQDFLKQGSGACRVHGGGFAGTIQAYIPLDRLQEYRKLIEKIFGTGTLTVLRIRPAGAIELDL